MGKDKEPIIGTAGGVIAGMITLMLFVIALMPPCDRCMLLNEDDECLDVCDDLELKDVLLLEYPGDLSDDQVKEYELGNINLFLKDEPELKTLASNLKIERSIFGDSSQELSFRVDDIENLKELMLYFSVLDPKGDLVIELNGNIVFNGFKRAGIVEVILPTDYIEENNNIKISVTSGFFVKNHYDLRDIKIKKVFEKKNSLAIETFRVSSSEKRNIKDAELSFFIYCKELDGYGRFKLYLNDKILVDEPLICSGGKKTINLDKDDFESGSNVLEFSIDNGDFMFNDITVRNEYDEGVENEYEYDFEVDTEQWDMIRDGDDVILEMEFDGDRIVADIIINGYTIGIDTSSNSFEKDITQHIRKGDNDFKIIPNTDFEIDELKISLED
ncbi:MAG: hypothetical protein ABIJ20_04890 [Nanoarchaeota archaeon]|nr:hypothetical protein [Nanoarchaeota archaeon]MBU1444960.1 hypothetical protein [Nanoarchaeota archaeon]MBU2406466.1 hypothetical protein [Nanoarchaeota archaeon]MBU2420418.1 hypothetical protein [Nanoarchaeota archaeon]MBU2475714.1 hypothetical protein [Nanoarchaeota archaeon]